VREGASPAHAREVLDAGSRRTERVLLEVRLRSGLSLDVLDDAGRGAVADLVDDGLVTLTGTTLQLTTRGRLLADAVVRALLP
jgi:oxygen-independent coproporphyrinogen-3 oxidase